MSLKLNKELKEINSDLSFVLKDLPSRIPWANCTHADPLMGLFWIFSLAVKPCCKHVGNIVASKCHYCPHISFVCMMQMVMRDERQTHTRIWNWGWDYMDVSLNGSTGLSSSCILLHPTTSHSYLCCAFSCVTIARWWVGLIVNSSSFEITFFFS